MINKFLVAAFSMLTPHERANFWRHIEEGYGVLCSGDIFSNGDGRA